jgi:perosamine synthetase
VKLKRVESRPSIFEYFGKSPRPILKLFPSEIAPNSSTSPYKFAYARTALKHGLSALGFKSGDCLLVPELICDSAIEPLRDIGITLRYYPVTEKLEPDWSAIDRSFIDTTKGFLIINYFGQPQDIPACIEFCHNNKMLLIEDNAHGYGGTYNRQLLGTFGDIGITSLRKSLPVPYGAFLYFAQEDGHKLSDLIIDKCPSISLKRRLKYSISQIPVVNNAAKLWDAAKLHRSQMSDPPPYGKHDAFRDDCIRVDYGMDKHSYNIVIGQNLDQIRKIRQDIYRIWQNWAKSERLTAVFDNLACGAAPLVFPAYADSISSSLKWFEAGHRTGIDIHSWPTLPWSVINKNSSAVRIWERLVCFPIHQEMDTKLLKQRLAYFHMKL